MYEMLPRGAAKQKELADWYHKIIRRKKVEPVLLF